MHFERSTTFDGIGIKEIRSLLRRHKRRVSLSDISDFFHRDLAGAKTLAASLVADGLLLMDPDEESFAVTARGKQLLLANFSKRMTRETAERLLEEILSRVKQINSQRELTHRVSEIYVFGSYLTDAPDLGDLDLVVVLAPRVLDNHRRMLRSIARAEATGRNMNYLNQLFFGEEEVRQLLRSGNGRISIHEISEVEGFDVATKRVFPAGGRRKLKRQ